MTTTLVNKQLSQNDFSVYFSKQTTQGAIDTDPVFTKVHLRTGGMGVLTPTFEQSSAISTTGQPRDNIKTGEDYAAELSTEMNNQHKDFAELGLEGEAVQLQAAGTDLSSTASGFNFAGAMPDFEVGDIIFATGFADAGVNVTYQITAISGQDITTSPSPSAVEAGAAGNTISTNKVTLGTAPTLIALQNRAPDLSQTGDVAYRTFYNGFTNTYGVSVPESGIITSTMNVLFEKIMPGLAEISGQTDASEPNFQPSGTPLTEVWIDGVYNQDCILKNADITVEHGYTGNAVAQCSGKRMAKSSPTVSGSIGFIALTDDTYFWENKVNTNTPIRLAYGIKLDNSQEMVIGVPRAKMTSHTFDGDTAITNSMEYSAETDRTTGKALYIYFNF